MESSGFDRPALDHHALARIAPPWTVEVVEAAPSTNTVVTERAVDGTPEGLVVLAEHQTAGRGRLGRSWESPARASLTFSVLLRPTVEDRWWPWLPLLTGLAVCDGVGAVGGPPCGLKWPNDVLVDGAKVAGLLAERVDTRSGPAAVVGVGLNVSQSLDELPVPGAASLRTVGFPTLDRTGLLVAVLDALHSRYQVWSAAAGRPGGALVEEYRRRCVTIGEQVQVTLPDGRVVRGRASGVDQDGALEVDDGARRISVNAGDVLHVRPLR